MKDKLAAMACSFFQACSKIVSVAHFSFVVLDSDYLWAICPLLRAVRFAGEWWAEKTNQFVLDF